MSTVSDMSRWLCSPAVFLLPCGLLQHVPVSSPLVDEASVDDVPELLADFAACDFEARSNPHLQGLCLLSASKMCADNYQSIHQANAKT
eukprot:449928-Amphidinium_carterae.2